MNFSEELKRMITTSREVILIEDFNEQLPRWIKKLALKNVSRVDSTQVIWPVLALGATLFQDEDQISVADIFSHFDTSFRFENDCNQVSPQLSDWTEFRLQSIINLRQNQYQLAPNDQTSNEGRNFDNSKLTLKVKGFSSEKSQDLKTFFQQFGKITFCKVFSKEKGKKYALVEF